jgi:outer membrane immunogenic protein
VIVNARLISGLIGAVILATVPANAADVPFDPPGRYAAPIAPPPLAFGPWAGPYVGLNLGYTWGSIGNLPLSPSGFAGGAQAGYGWQFEQIVLGAETDIQFSGATDTFAPYKFANPWFGTLRGRVGIAFSNVLVYATAGLAYGEGKLNSLRFIEDQTNLGWTVGGGIEVGLGFLPHWSARAEYLYYDLGNQSYILTQTDSGFAASLLRFGVNYRFSCC